MGLENGMRIFVRQSAENFTQVQCTNDRKVRKVRDERTNAKHLQDAKMCVTRCCDAIAENEKNVFN